MRFFPVKMQTAKFMLPMFSDTYIRLDIFSVYTFQKYQITFYALLLFPGDIKIRMSLII